jgi:hypothetical protein
MQSVWPQCSQNTDLETPGPHRVRQTGTRSPGAQGLSLCMSVCLNGSVFLCLSLVVNVSLQPCPGRLPVVTLTKWPECSPDMGSQPQCLWKD